MGVSSKSGSGSASGSPSMTIESCNYPASTDPTSYKDHLQVVIRVLTGHPLSRALFTPPPPSIPFSLLEQYVVTVTKSDNNIFVTLSHGMDVTLDKKMFASALNLPFHEAQLNTPSQSELLTMFYLMGYEYKMESP
ncbi:hypothetical protein L2E82_30841 [Cichorium intybus]|uniref:Uncharacterized protein n=1 Tax=Cichorium intybus TaxID=13427 RepID=A0ACB9D284_CICIN|nr:hypothetical protein L2E82_30841 [Cichorium intybus]